MNLNSKSTTQSKSQVSFSDDLEDSFVEIFRSCQNYNSVSQENGKQKRKELPVSLTQKQGSVSNANVVQKDELSHVNEIESTSKLNEICNLLKDNVIQHCPICFKKNTCDQISGFIAHLKGCASKHKISTEQLIKAVQLVEKQSSERIALGLPKIATEKSTRKNYTKKVGVDSNMQLAMALSASLRESEFLTRLKETETLIEAGLEQEVVLSCKQLEDFGFKTSKQCDVRPPKINYRCKNRNTILFSRSQAERERIITEKVAIILIDSDGPNSDSLLSASSYYFEPKSKYLRNIRDKNSEVWKKSFQSNEEASDQCYYLENLSSFISPCKVEIGAKLKHVSQIPGRISSDESHFSRSLQDLMEFFRPTTRKDPPKATTKIISSHPVIQKPKISRLSADYKSLVNKKLMSDITIYAKNERSIYAHKLMFYARCGAILDDSIKETVNGKTSEIIMWMEFSYESVIAFLEYVYADALDSVPQLNESQLSDLSQLCARYHVKDLESCINELTLKEPFATIAVPAEENFDNHLGHSSECTIVDKTNDSTRSRSPVNGEQNLEFLQMALATQHEQPSPEMFVDSDTPFVEENDFSLSIQDSSPTFDDPPINSGDSTAMKKCETNFAELSQKLSLRIDGEKTPPWTCDTDVIILSDDDDLIGIPQDLDQSMTQNMNQMKLNGVKSEKRKSASPLLMSPVKKPTLLKGSPPRKTSVKSKVRRKRPMKSSSQYTMSDSFESSDSDESLYKIKTNVCESSPGCSFSASLTQRSSKPLTKNNQSQQDDKLTSADSSFELDNFRNLVPETRNFNGSEVVGERCHSKLLADGGNFGAEVEEPYISPIWDGFDDYQDNYFEAYSSSPVAPVSKFSTPVKNLLTKSLVSPVSLRNFHRNSSKADELPGNKNCVSPGAADVPAFESFSIDESVLSKLESKSNVSKPGALTQVSTPSNVRKFKARSKSDTFLTPSPRGNGRVTPMANYSGMKTVELKRELDKYGLKPGLSKPKAKKLLRHIYDQLHPLEEETTPKRQPEEKLKPKKSRKNSARSNNADEKLAAISADTDESSDSFASGIEELEASFADDVQNVDNIEESKSQKVSIDTGFRNLLREDKELHTQILLYEPIWLDQVKIKLKEKNIKCSSLALMNYLDEECITFRTRNQRRVRTKKKKIKPTVEAQAT